MSIWGTDVERERRARIQLSVGAYAYEIANKPVLPDDIFDWLAENIQPQLTTGHPLLDEFFLTEFSPMTGMWIHQHPELGKIATIFNRYWAHNSEHLTKIHSKKMERLFPRSAARG